MQFSQTLSSNPCPLRSKNCLLGSFLLLALLNDFRHFDYATEYKYPTVVLDQMKGLLAKYENL